MAPYDFRNDPLGVVDRFLGPTDVEAPRTEATGSSGRTWPGTGVPYDLVARTIGAQALGEEPATDDEDVTVDEGTSPVGVPIVAEQREPVMRPPPPVVVNVNNTPDTQVTQGGPPAPAPQDQAPQAPPAGQGDVAPPPQTVFETAGQVRDQATGMRLDANAIGGALAVEGALAAVPEVERAYLEKEAIREQAFRAEQAYQMDVMRTRERLRSAVDAVGAANDPFSGPGGSDRIMAYALAGISSQFGGGTGNVLVRMIEADVAASQSKAKDSVDAITKEMAAIGGMREDMARSFDAQVGLREKALADRLGVIAAQLAPGQQQAAALGLQAGILEDYEKRMTALAKEDIEYRKTEAEIGKIEAETRKADADARKADRSGRGGGGGGSAGLMSGQYASWDDVPAKKRRQVVQMHDGTWLDVGDKDLKKEADQILADSLVVTRGIDHALGLTGPEDTRGLLKRGWDNFFAGTGLSDDEAVELSAALTTLLVDLKEYWDLGAITEADKKLLEDAGADPKAVQDVARTIWPKLQKLRQAVIRGAQIRLEQRGIRYDAEDRHGSAPAAPSKDTSDDIRDRLESPVPGFDSGRPVPQVAVDTIDDIRSYRALLDEEGRLDEYSGFLKQQVTRRTSRLTMAKDKVDEHKRLAEAARRKGDRKKAEEHEQSVIKYRTVIYNETDVIKWLNSERSTFDGRKTKKPSSGERIWQDYDATREQKRADEKRRKADEKKRADEERRRADEKKLEEDWRERARRQGWGDY